MQLSFKLLTPPIWDDFETRNGLAHSVNAVPVAVAFAWTGIAKAFIRTGFKEVKRRSPTRPIVRLQLD